MIAQLLQDAQNRLRHAGLEQPDLEGEFLLSELMGLTRPDLQWRRKQNVDPALRDQFERGLAERIQRKPLAYIVGHQPFLDLSISVNPSVLIPRPETETLAENILADLDTWETDARIVDVGTGSGILAIALARHPRVIESIGLDRSPQALDIAKANARRLVLDQKCSWFESDLLSQCPESGLRTLYVANLPYIKHDDLAKLSPEVQWEPRLALDGGADGLEVILRFLEQAAERLKRDDVLWLEVGYDQSTEVEKRLLHSGYWCSVIINKDLAGWPRMVRAIRGDKSWIC